MDYTEVHFEELERDPCPVLRRLSGFLEHDLGYDRIMENWIGAVAKPNSSFRRSTKETSIPIAQWKYQLTTDQVARIEGLVRSRSRNLDTKWHHWAVSNAIRYISGMESSAVPPVLRILAPVEEEHGAESPAQTSDFEGRGWDDIGRRRAAARLHAGARPTADCDLPQEGSTVGRMAGQP